MILKVIFILCLICFAFGTDIKQVGNFDTSIENPLQNYAVSQNFQEKDETAHLYDSHNWFKTVKNGGSNQKQMRQKKEKFNLLSCCFKKSKENKSKTKDESNTKIKIKAKNNFDHECHKILTYVFTGKLVKFGNYSCLPKEEATRLVQEACSWSSFSGSVTKIISDRVSVHLRRAKIPFAPNRRH
jgi:hypothetical protein